MMVLIPKQPIRCIGFCHLHIYISKKFVSGIAPLYEAHVNGNAVGAG